MNCAFVTPVPGPDVRTITTINNNRCRYLNVRKHRTLRVHKHITRAVVAGRSSNRKFLSSTSFEQVGASDAGLTLERLAGYCRSGWRLTLPFFRDEVGARWHFLFVLALTALFSGCGVMWTVTYGNLMTAMSERSGSQIMRSIAKLGALMAFFIPMGVLKSYASSTFQLRWCRYMTNKLLGLYFAAKNYYKITCGAGGIDNPDEVLFEQISQFTNSAFHFIIDNFRTVLDTVFYSVLLIKLSPSLFIIGVLIAALSSLGVNKVGRRMLAFEALYIKLGANFRFALARTRIFAESIAFYDGSRKEHEVAAQAFNSAADCKLNIFGLQRFVDAFDRTFSYLPDMLPYAYLAPQYLKNTITLGHITQADGAFLTLAGNLSYYVESYQWLVQVGASIERLTRFVDFVNSEVAFDKRVFSLPSVVLPTVSMHELDDDSDNVKSATAENCEDSITTDESENIGHLELRNLSLVTPGSRRALLHLLNLDVCKDERLLIVGPSGVGKTSLLRAIAGLWTTGSGSVARPPTNDCFFIPQRPYCVLGTLREQLTYPRDDSSESIPDDNLLRSALSMVGLSYLVQNYDLDNMQNWADVLSFGETQRIAFARLVLSNASFVIIDEGTSALDLASEELVMGLVAKKGRIVVSVGHRPSLLKFHDTVLSLSSDASWKITSAHEFVYPLF